MAVDFLETGGEKRMTGTIVSAILPGWWMIKDGRRKKYRVASEEHWRVGDEVAVIGGQIVGLAGKTEQPKVYRV